jgi:hypothetical protein
MEQDPIIQQADNYLSQEYFPDQLREKQDQEYYITQGIERIKDIRNELDQQLKVKTKEIDDCVNELKVHSKNNTATKEYDMIVAIIQISL